MTAIQIITMNERWACGSVGMLLVTSWVSQLTVPDIRAAGETGVRFRSTLPGGRYGTLAIVQGGVPMPAPETRKFAASITRSEASSIVAQGTVLEGAGFWASTARLVLNAVNALAMATTHHVTGDLYDAAQHFVDALGADNVGGDAKALGDALVAFRTAHVEKRGSPARAPKWFKGEGP